MKKEQLAALRNNDLALLDAILKDKATSPAVKIQAIQTREKILGAIEEKMKPEEKPAIERIMDEMKDVRG